MALERGGNTGDELASADPGRVVLDHVGNLSVITLDRPAVRNALSGVMLRQLVRAVEDAVGEPGTRGIVLTGAGSAFCSGDDIGEVATTNAETFDENIALLQRVSRLLWDSAKPTVAALNGAAIGGGLELTLVCDLRLAAEQAVFACPEVAWGLICTNGASTLLPAIIGHGRAREMLLTGRTYDAGWALASGLVSEVLPRAALLDRALALAEELTARPSAVALTRDLLRDGAAMLVRALDRETAAVGEARRGTEALTNLRRFGTRHDLGGMRR